MQPDASEAGSEERETKSLFSETLVLASLPAIAYGVTFGVEFGFCRYFRIPASLIEVSLSDVLVTLGMMVLMLLFGYVVLHSGYLRYRRSRLGFSTLKRAFVFALFWILLTLAFLWVARPSLSEIAASVLVGLIIWRLLEATPTTSEKRDDDEVYVLQFHLPSLQFLVALLVLALVFVSPVVGRGVARRKVDFLVSATHPNQVVLRQYGDYWIVGSLSAGRRHLESELRVVAISAPNLEEAETFRLEPIGPLRVVEPR